jgi:hypothetical protein
MHQLKEMIEQERQEEVRRKEELERRTILAEIEKFVYASCGA